MSSDDSKTCTKIGLCGGIASGKSAVLEILKKSGFEISNADILGHQAYSDPDVFKQLIDTFGEDIKAADGGIDRKKLGPIVFSSKDDMQKLNDIMWPAIRKKAGALLAEKQAAGIELICMEAAVMIEAGWQDLFDEVWVTEVDKPIALERLKSRNKLSDEQALQRINAQLSNEKRCEHARVVITNNGTEEELERDVAEKVAELRARIANGEVGRS